MKSCLECVYTHTCTRTHTLTLTHTLTMTLIVPGRLTYNSVTGDRVMLEVRWSAKKLKVHSVLHILNHNQVLCFSWFSFDLGDVLLKGVNRAELIGINSHL